MTIRLEVVNIWILAWAGLAKCKGKTLIACTVQYWCSVSKAKHGQVFSATLLNGHKIQISLQLPDCDLTWRVASTAIGLYVGIQRKRNFLFWKIFSWSNKSKRKISRQIRFTDCLNFLLLYTRYFTMPASMFTILVTIYRIHLGRLLNVQEDLCAISCNQNTLCLECELHPEIRSFLPNGCVMPSLLCRCQLLMLQGVVFE